MYTTVKKERYIPDEMYYNGVVKNPLG